MSLLMAIFVISYLTYKTMPATLQPSDVTLYIPCYNVEATLLDCLAGIAAQTQAPAHVLLVDDGSTIPISEHLLNQAGLQGKIIRHYTNMGLAAARNSALRVCGTKLIAAIDADVLPASDWLEQLLLVLNTKDVAGAGGMLTEYCQDTVGDRWRAVHMAQHWGAQPCYNPRFLYGANTIFHAEALRAVGGYDARLHSNNEDRTVCDALYKHGYALAYTPQARCRHLRRDTSRSILPGYWRWHHAAGLLRGEFDQPAGLMERIKRVNFGIYRYRYDLDLAAKRYEFLMLDWALPWVFCMQDLWCHHRQTGAYVPTFPLTAHLQDIPPKAALALKTLLPEILPAGQVQAEPSWFQDYSARFRAVLQECNWLNDCPIIYGDYQLHL